MDQDSQIRRIQARLKTPIIPIGLMGSGKSHVGERLAQSLGLSFMDVDRVIEDEEGCSIAALFETKGEPYFRARERETISRLISGDVCVLSPGGGAIMAADTADLIFGNTLSLWLNADMDVLVDRVSRNSNRPLLKNGDPRDILTGLLERRGPIYAKAHITVDSNSPDVAVTVAKALNAIDDYLKEDNL